MDINLRDAVVMNKRISIKFYSQYMYSFLVPPPARPFATADSLRYFPPPLRLFIFLIDNCAF